MNKEQLKNLTRAEAEKLIQEDHSYTMVGAILYERKNGQWERLKSYEIGGQDDDLGEI